MDGSARALAARIAAGETTSVDAVDAAIARIEAVNDSLNAVCVKRFDAARREAAEADRQRGAGRPLGPLHGVPMTVKECLDLAGTPSTFGIPARAGRPVPADDEVVARLRAAGAIVVGKTNVAQLLLFVECENPVYGRTQNPWDLQRSPGGSSGGEGAIIAAGGSPLGLGTDIGGSCRIPAAFCGVVGFKPTAGRLDDPGTGSVPLGQRAIVSQIGVLARFVEDAALALEIANGGRAPAVEPPRPLGDPAAVDLGGLRVGFFLDDGGFAASPALRRAVRDAGGILERAGAKVAEWRPPDPGEAVFLLLGILSGDGARGFQRLLGDGARDPHIKLLETAARLPGPARAALGVALRLSGRGKSAKLLRAYGHTRVDQHWQLVEQLLGYRKRFAAAMDAAGLDAVLLPPIGLPALRHGASLDVGLAGAYSCLANVLGWPAGVVPVTEVQPGEESDRPPSKDKLDQAARETERGSAGLPIGVQVLARPWREHVAFAIMAAIERGAGRAGRLASI